MKLRVFYISALFFLVFGFLPVDSASKVYLANHPAIKEEIIHTFSNDFWTPWRSQFNSFPFWTAEGRFAYIAPVKTFGSQKGFLIVDGTSVMELDVHSNLTYFNFIKNGEGYCYYRVYGGALSQKGKNLFYYDGKECPNLNIAADSIRLSEDGKHIFYINYDGQVFVDEKKVFEVGSGHIIPKSLNVFYNSTTGDVDFSYKKEEVFSSKEFVVIGNKQVMGSSFKRVNESYAYIDKSVEKKETVILNGTPQGTFEKVSELALAAPGDRVAYAVREGEAYSIYENKSKVASFKKYVSVPVYSSNGKHMAFYGSDEKGSLSLYVDGKIVYANDLIALPEEFDLYPYLNGEGDRWIFIMVKDSAWGGDAKKNWSVTIGGLDGAEVKNFAQIGCDIAKFQFSPSGDHFAYAVQSKNFQDYRSWRYKVILDGEMSREYMNVFDLKLMEDKLTFITVDKENVVRVTWEIK